MSEAYVTPAGVLIPKEILEAGPEDRIIVRKVYDYMVVRKYPILYNGLLRRWNRLAST